MVTQQNSFDEVRILTPADDFLAVYAKDEGGGIVIETAPFDFIGIGHDWYSGHSDVVGLNQREELFSIINNDHFYGIVHAVATWEECVDLLPDELQPQVITAREGGVHAVN